MPGDCALCRMVNGQIKIDALCRTGTLLAVLNRWEPLSQGHALIFPKRHVANFHEMSPAELSELLPVVRRLAFALEVRNYNVIQNNGALAHQTVFHAHFHLIPKWSEADGLGLTWNVVGNLDQGAVHARTTGNLAGEIT
jgi:diadenosine tetraphosphate (Ap4A) HIT family hydrolase